MKKAFTLSELLITLVIVGVISILTVPNVMRNVWNSSNVAKLEATYKTLNDAVKNMLINERTGSVSDSSLFEDPGKFFNNYMKMIKDCETSYKGCFADTYKSISGNAVDKSFLRTSATNEALAYYAMLPSGASVGFISDKLSGIGTGSFVIDVNGIDGPNTAGRDLFTVRVYENGSLGTQYYDEYEDIDVRITRCQNGIAYGEPCFSQLQSNNWKMDY